MYGIRLKFPNQDEMNGMSALTECACLDEKEDKNCVWGENADSS